MRKLQEVTQRKFCEQGGRCHYCRQLMWLADPISFARTHGIPLQRSRVLQATAEHLLARSEGGLDCAANIVAACRFCNCTRHRARLPLDPEAYRQKVKARMASGKWHGLRVQ